MSVDQVNKRSVKGGSGHNKVAVEVDGLPLGRAGLRAVGRIILAVDSSPFDGELS